MKAKIIHAKTGLLRIAVVLFLLSAGIPLKAENHWTPDTTPYEDYMTITGYIVRNGLELASSQYEVGCFIDGECRASYRLAEVSYPGHTHPCFLSIWGSASDNGKAITLRVYDHDSGETWPVDQKPVYQYGESIGVEAPVRLTVVSSAPTYTVTIMTTGNGAVTSDKQDVFEAETVTLTIQPAEKHELESVVAYKSGSASVTVPLTGAGNSRTFVMPGYDVTVSATFRKTQAALDEEAVAAAKVVVEGGSFNLNQKEGNTESTVKSWLTKRLNTLLAETNVSVTEANITINSFAPATEGSEANPSGTNGSYNFTVALTKGASTATAGKNGNTIFAMSYNSYYISFAEMENGTVTANETEVEAGVTITLTIVPSTGYEVENITVCKTGDASITVTLLGAGNIRTFVMPAYDVTVSATFKKDTDQVSVEIAKEAVKNATYTVQQAVANTESSVKTWLANHINTILQQGSTGIAVTEEDITFTSFSAAVEGTASNQDGINGDFRFTVLLTKGNYSEATPPIAGTIIATPYENAIEDVESNALRIVSTDSGLWITNLIPNEVLRVYDIRGWLLFEQRMTATEQSVNLHHHGIYIVTNGKQKAKVLF